MADDRKIDIPLTNQIQGERSPEPEPEPEPGPGFERRPEPEPPRTKGPWSPQTIAALAIAGAIAFFALQQKNGNQPNAPAPDSGEPSVSSSFDQAQASPGAPSATSGGPFSYRFVKGERLRYRLDGHASGTGFEAGVGSEIGLQIGFDLGLLTENVDSWGNATLRMDFDTVSMTGNFMGSPVQLYQSKDNVNMNLGGSAQVDTSQGQSFAGIPQLDFFSRPISITAAPDGSVTNVSGPPGFETIVSPAKMLSPVQLPSGDIAPGYTWDSEFNLPVPGLGSAAPAKSRNTFIGYEMLNGRRCGVIRQELQSSQQAGSISSPSSILGESLNMAMPKFDVKGNNTIYFDTAEGKLLRTDISLMFSLQIGQSLEPVKQMLNSYSQILGEIDGQRRPDASQSQPDLDMGVKIEASMALL